ncbi:hypothetical protein KIPB_001059 [Kipferlia bialata]|uniref:Guanylate cyclase domain-containing protein n=1 Tax=Kipferlia bialata TaxID=797122 RepID=A0A9K3CQ26_9EUKA|nr:hypothetical protein KIPB_001059 [Kipferlia bialata]|eukprot:g1059.t1
MLVLFPTMPDNLASLLPSNAQGADGDTSDQAGEEGPRGSESEAEESDSEGLPGLVIRGASTASCLKSEKRKERERERQRERERRAAGVKSSLWTGSGSGSGSDKAKAEGTTGAGQRQTFGAGPIGHIFTPTTSVTPAFGPIADGWYTVVRPDLTRSVCTLPVLSLPPARLPSFLASSVTRVALCFASPQPVAKLGLLIRNAQRHNSPLSRPSLTLSRDGMRRSQRRGDQMRENGERHTYTKSADEGEREEDVPVIRQSSAGGMQRSGTKTGGEREPGQDMDEDEMEAVRRTVSLPQHSHSRGGLMFPRRGIDETYGKQGVRGDVKQHQLRERERILRQMENDSEKRERGDGSDIDTGDDTDEDQTTSSASIEGGLRSGDEGETETDRDTRPAPVQIPSDPDASESLLEAPEGTVLGDMTTTFDWDPISCTALVRPSRDGDRGIEGNMDGDQLPRATTHHNGDREIPKDGAPMSYVDDVFQSMRRPQCLPSPLYYSTCGATASVDPGRVRTLDKTDREASAIFPQAAHRPVFGPHKKAAYEREHQAMKGIQKKIQKRSTLHTPSRPLGVKGSASNMSLPTVTEKHEMEERLKARSRSFRALPDSDSDSADVSKALGEGPEGASRGFSNRGRTGEADWTGVEAVRVRAGSMAGVPNRGSRTLLDSPPSAVPAVRQVLPVGDSPITGTAPYTSACGETPRTKDGEVRLRSRSLLCAVAIVDVRGFTAISECLGPQTSMVFLRRLFARFVSVSERMGGRVVKFLGDGIVLIFRTCHLALCAVSALNVELTLFNSYLRTPPGEASSLAGTPLGMDSPDDAFTIDPDTAAQIKGEMDAGLPELSVGAGISFGIVSIGPVSPVGSRDLAVPCEVSIIGGAFDEASSLEQKTKALGCPILVGQDVVRRANAEVAMACRLMQGATNPVLRPLGFHSAEQRRLQRKREREREKRRSLDRKAPGPGGVRSSSLPDPSASAGCTLCSQGADSDQYNDVKSTSSGGCNEKGERDSAWFETAKERYSVPFTLHNNRVSSFLIDHTSVLPTFTRFMRGAIQRTFRPKSHQCVQCSSGNHSHTQCTHGSERHRPSSGLYQSDDSDDTEEDVHVVDDMANLSEKDASASLDCASCGGIGMGGTSTDSQPAPEVSPLAASLDASLTHAVATFDTYLSENFVTMPPYALARLIGKPYQSRVICTDGLTAIERDQERERERQQEEKEKARSAGESNYHKGPVPRDAKWDDAGGTHTLYQVTAQSDVSGAVLQASRELERDVTRVMDIYERYLDERDDYNDGVPFLPNFPTPLACACTYVDEMPDDEYTQYVELIESTIRQSRTKHFAEHIRTEPYLLSEDRFERYLAGAMVIAKIFRAHYTVPAAFVQPTVSPLGPAFCLRLILCRCIRASREELQKQENRKRRAEARRMKRESSLLQNKVRREESVPAGAYSVVRTSSSGAPVGPQRESSAPSKLPRDTSNTISGATTSDAASRTTSGVMSNSSRTSSNHHGLDSRGNSTTSTLPAQDDRQERERKQKEKDQKVEPPFAPAAYGHLYGPIAATYPGQCIYSCAGFFGEICIQIARRECIRKEREREYVRKAWVELHGDSESDTESEGLESSEEFTEIEGVEISSEPEKAEESEDICESRLEMLAALEKQHVPCVCIKCGGVTSESGPNRRNLSTHLIIRDGRPGDRQGSPDIVSRDGSDVSDVLATSPECVSDAAPARTLLKSASGLSVGMVAADCERQGQREREREREASGGDSSHESGAEAVGDTDHTDATDEERETDSEEAGYERERESWRMQRGERRERRSELGLVMRSGHFFGGSSRSSRSASRSGSSSAANSRGAIGSRGSSIASMRWRSRCRRRVAWEDSPFLMKEIDSVVFSRKHAKELSINPDRKDEVAASFLFEEITRALPPAQVQLARVSPVSPSTKPRFVTPLLGEKGLSTSESVLKARAQERDRERDRERDSLVSSPMSPVSMRVDASAHAPQTMAQYVVTDQSRSLTKVVPNPPALKTTAALGTADGRRIPVDRPLVCSIADNSVKCSAQEWIKPLLDAGHHPTPLTLYLPEVLTRFNCTGGREAFLDTKAFLQTASRLHVFLHAPHRERHTMAIIHSVSDRLKQPEGDEHLCLFDESRERTGMNDRSIRGDILPYLPSPYSPCDRERYRHLIDAVCMQHDSHNPFVGAARPLICPPPFPALAFLDQDLLEHRHRNGLARDFVRYALYARRWTPMVEWFCGSHVNCAIKNDVVAVGMVCREVPNPVVTACAEAGFIRMCRLNREYTTLAKKDRPSPEAKESLPDPLADDEYNKMSRREKERERHRIEKERRARKRRERDPVWQRKEALERAERERAKRIIRDEQIELLGRVSGLVHIPDALMVQTSVMGAGCLTESWVAGAVAEYQYTARHDPLVAQRRVNREKRRVRDMRFDANQRRVERKRQKDAADKDRLRRLAAQAELQRLTGIAPSASENGTVLVSGSGSGHRHRHRRGQTSHRGQGRERERERSERHMQRQGRERVRERDCDRLRPHRGTAFTDAVPTHHANL